MSHTPRTPQGASFWDKNKNLLLRVVLCLLLATATVLTVWYSARTPATISPDNDDADQPQSDDPCPRRMNNIRLTGRGPQPDCMLIRTAPVFH